MGENKKYPPPYSLRLTFEERQRLDRDAGNMPISAYIRERLFDEPSPRRRISPRLKEQEIFLEILKEFSDMRIANNLNQLAKASHEGRLILAPKTQENLEQACEAIKAIKTEILNHLGLKLPKGGGL